MLPAYYPFHANSSLGFPKQETLDRTLGHEQALNMRESQAVPRSPKEGGWQGATAKGVRWAWSCGYSLVGSSQKNNSNSTTKHFSQH